MPAELDRLDRMLLAAAAAALAMPPPAPPPAPRRDLEKKRKRRAVLRAAVSDASPSIFMRGPKYVDYMTCPMCSADREGIEYHGELMSGAKVHTIQAHAAGMRRTAKGQPRCLGAGMRVVFEGGVWKGAPTP